MFAQVNLAVNGSNPYLLNGQSTIAEILQYSEAVALVNKYSGNIFEQVDEDQLKFMVDLKLSDLLSGILISTIPDSARVDQILSNLYEELKQL